VCNEVDQMQVSEYVLEWCQCECGVGDVSDSGSDGNEEEEGEEREREGGAQYSAREKKTN